MCFVYLSVYVLYYEFTLYVTCINLLGKVEWKHVIPVLDALIFNSLSNLLHVSTVHSYSILRISGFFFVYDVELHVRMGWISVESFSIKSFISDYVDINLK